MIRTDIHRPSAIIPADYRFVAMELVKVEGLGDAEFLMRQREIIRNDMARTGGTYSTHAHGGNCHVCGNANAMYTALFHHADTNSYIRMGTDCADKCDMGNPEAFRTFKANCRTARDAAKGKQKAQLILADEGLDLAWAVATGPFVDKYEESTIKSIVGNLVKYGSISEKQIAFVRTLLNKIENRAALEAARAAEKAASVYVGTVGARVTMPVTVRAVPSFYTAYGECYVSICKDDAGNTIIYKGNKPLAEKGKRVVVTATIKEHGTRDNEAQTIIARPKVAA